MAMVRYARLQQYDEINDARYQLSSDCLRNCENDTNEVIEEIEDVIHDHDLVGQALEGGATIGRSSTEPLDLSLQSPLKGKAARGPQETTEDEFDEPSGSEEIDLPKTLARNAHKSKKRALLQRLREFKLLLHRIKFLQGDLWSARGELYAVPESEAYEAADQIRRTLLNGKVVRKKVGAQT